MSPFNSKPLGGGDREPQRNQRARLPVFHKKALILSVLMFSFYLLSLRDALNQQSGHRRAGKYHFAIAIVRATTW